MYINFISILIFNILDNSTIETDMSANKNHNYTGTLKTSKLQLYTN